MAAGADISGRWWIDTSAATAAQGARGGSVYGGEFEFKVSGDVLTGSASRMRGNQMAWTPILDGKITGDRVSFSAMTRDMNEEEFKLSYAGRITADRIELTVDFGGRGDPLRISLRRP
jgi:hypothetical protein